MKIFGNWEKDNKDFLDLIISESKKSKEILFVSGFSSLGFFSHLFKEVYLDPNRTTKKIKFIIGNEVTKPTYRIQEEVKKHFKNNSFDYYYFSGIELLKKFLSNKKLLDKELGFSRDLDLEIKIEEGERTLHAKIFVYDNSIIHGSSNLSYSGTVSQLELNSQVFSSEETFPVIKSIAQEYWNSKTAVDYKKDLLSLFEENITFCDSFENAMHVFQDNFINGDWFRKESLKYQEEFYNQLWVHQQRSIGQAVTILQKYGAVIIAEPTGSGKTKIATTILKWLYDNTESRGLGGNIVVVCPPNVVDEWTNEIQNKYKISGVDIISSGIINSIDDDKHRSKLLNLQNAKIVLIDEAHTYSNLLSKRGKNLLINNSSDYLILLTATPLNKVLDDYKGLLMQVGGDALDVNDINNLNKYVFSGNADYIFDLQEKQKEFYKKAITSVTVRKTKKEINEFSLANKKNTQTGRYPVEITQNYQFNFNLQQLEKIKKILELQEKLSGLAYFRKDIENIISEKKERSRSKGLSKHFLIYNFRSSKAAFIEHICGTKQASIDCDIPLDDKYSINGKISDLKSFKNVIFKKNKIWSSKQLFEEEIDKEINIYEQMYQIIKGMDDVVAQSKISKILEIMSNPTNRGYKKCLVFDKTPITVIYLENIIKKIIKENKLNYTTIAIIGENKLNYLDQFKEYFGLNKNNEYKPINCIGFASNILSESVNLQGADTILFSDTPLTPVMAEQRIGRISRMNSPYDEISIYWPDMIEELYLNTDSLLIFRFQNIEELIQNNITIPNFLKNKVIEKSNLEFLIEEENNQESILKKIVKNQDIDLGEELEYEINNELQTFKKLVDNKDLDIEDYFEKLNQFFIKILGKNKISNIKNNNLYNFINITTKNESEWGLFVITTNVKSTPQIIFIDKQKNIYETDLDKIVISLEKNISNIEEVNQLSLLSKNNTISEEVFSETMKWYNKTIKNSFLKATSILNRKTSKTFEEFDKYINYLIGVESQKGNPNTTIINGYQEIKKIISTSNKNTNSIAQRWFYYFKDKWRDYLLDEFNNHKTKGSFSKVFNGKIPLFKDIKHKINTNKDFTSPEDLYLKFISGNNEENNEIKYNIKLAIVCFKKEDIK